MWSYQKQCVFQNPDISFASRLLAALGILCIALVGLRILMSACRGLYHCLVGQYFGLNVDLTKFRGQWAVVTGASDGIGRAYAEQLAEKGLNIVLIARTVSRLEDVAAVIRQAYKVDTKILSVDFSLSDRSPYEKIKELLAGLDVAVLVNNVGICYSYPEYFTLVPDGESLMDRIIEANCTAATRMTHIVLPKMVERRAGVIINMSSFSSTTPFPLLSVYSGTKVYLNFFSDALAAEYRQFGITVQCVKPFYVSTKMSRIPGGIYVPQPDALVRHALTTVGLEMSTYGCLSHKIHGYVHEVGLFFLPTWCRLQFSFFLMNSLRNIKYSKHNMTDRFKDTTKSSWSFVMLPFNLFASICVFVLTIKLPKRAFL